MEEGWKIQVQEEVKSKRSFIMSHEWSTDWESVSENEKARMIEEEVWFKEDPVAGCRGIFYGALFSSLVFLFLSFSLVLLYWIK